MTQATMTTTPSDLVTERLRAAFRGLSVDDQLREIRGTRVERVFQVERDGLDTDKRTAWLSIASEEPCERWWGVEILDVRAGSLRDKRLKSGAPLLVGHDPADQVGVVEDFEITPGRKLRVLARFGRSARAEEIWQDVLDGIRKNTSVGYIIHDLLLEKSEEGVNTYRVTDWEPLEGSLVSIPADPTVGVGRAFSPGAPQPSNERKAMNTETPIAPAAPAVDEAKLRADAEAAVHKRNQDVLAAAREFADLGGNDIALQVIAAGGDVAAFKARMLESMRGKQKVLATAEPAHVPYGDGARHAILRGRALRAFTQPLVYSDGSKMEPLECAYRSGQWLLAVVGGSERAKRWCVERGISVEQRVMQVGNNTLGGYLAPDEMEQSIIDLREQYGLARRLARRRVMGSDTKSIPKRTGGVTAYFIEEDNAGVTASDKGWGNVNLVSKTLAALTLISKNLEEDAIIDVVDDLAMEQAYAFAKKEDECWLIGDGTSTYGGMTGLKTLFDATAYASRFNAVTNHDTFPEFDHSDLVGVRGALGDLPMIRGPVWVCSKSFAESVIMRLKATAGGNNAGDLGAGAGYTYLGDSVFTTEILPKDPAADVSDTTVALYGDFGLSSSFGDRRGIMVEVLRERYAEKLQVGVLAHERFHIVNHDLGSTTVKGPVAALYGD